MLQTRLLSEVIHVTHFIMIHTNTGRYISVPFVPGTFLFFTPSFPPLSVVHREANVLNTFLSAFLPLVDVFCLDRCPVGSVADATCWKPSPSSSYPFTLMYGTERDASFYSSWYGHDCDWREGGGGGVIKLSFLYHLV